jgi:Skp family chaperone for outer membrane proteins
MNKLLTLALIAGFIVPAHSIELSLEENRGERGSIGYIDMQRLFKTFPETVRAKENFEELVRQAEEQINLRKAEVLRLRNEISQLKIEREFIAHNPVVRVEAPPKIPVRKPEPPKVEAPAPAPAATATVEPANPAARLPGMGAPKKPEPLTINIPGVSTAPIVVSPPEPSLPPPATQTVEFTPLPESATAQAAALPEPVAPQLNAALVEIDAKIAVKARELAQKESDYKEQQGAAEKNLLELESRKTEILLAKIYKAVQAAARKEGVSVVVDKGSILYGHDAVDLTERVLKTLKGEL